MSSRVPHRHTQPLTRAGLPATNACAGTSRVTTDPAAAKACSPISMPQTTTTPAPSVAPRRTRVPISSSPVRRIAARGRMSFVKSTFGPRNTSSSQVTPLKTSVPFLTVTWSPSTAPSSTKAPSQMLQSRPTTAPGRTCANAQTRVPGPTLVALAEPGGMDADAGGRRGHLVSAGHARASASISTTRRCWSRVISG